MGPSAVRSQPSAGGSLRAAAGGRPRAARAGGLQPSSRGSRRHPCHNGDSRSGPRRPLCGRGRGREGDRGADPRGGKSELRRAVRRVTPGRGNPTESGTENIPPAEAPGWWSAGCPAQSSRAPHAPLRCAGGSGDAPASPGGTTNPGPRRVRVKRCGKSAPRLPQGRWQAKPRTEQDQIGRRSRTARPKPPGRSLEAASDGGPRGMVVIGGAGPAAPPGQDSAYWPTAVSRPSPAGRSRGDPA